MAVGDAAVRAAQRSVDTVLSVMQQSRQHSGQWTLYIHEGSYQA